jgi:hypothetical protein
MATHLKNLKTGRVFIATDELLKRGDLMPCDAQGNVKGQHEDLRPPCPERKITPFLGNLANGRLLDYTQELALRPDLISIDTEEQWQSILDKNKPEVIEEDKTEIVSDANTVPNVFGLPNESARDALMVWASVHHGVDLDKRLSVQNLRERCLELAEPKAA